jgi:DNA-directed RNA polymerase subunit D
MKIQILERNEREMKILIEEINPQFANALRRIMIGEIPILAVDTVDFLQNDSVLYNEVITHRLALIPLVFDPKEFHSRDEHEGKKACSKCEVVFAIDKKGPSVVYSKDLKSSNDDVKPLYDTIPIVELLEGQKLKLEATAILGFGKVHAKWQAANVGYQYEDNKNPDKIIFNIESVSGLDVQQIFLSAIEVLKHKSKEFQKGLEKV